MNNKISWALVSLLLLWGGISVFAALPQQPVPAEKKRIMNKFDPVDIFPEAKERARKTHGKREKIREQKDLSVANGESPNPGPASSGRRKSRHRKSSPAAPETSKPGVNIAAVVVPTPTIPSDGIITPPSPKGANQVLNVQPASPGGTTRPAPQFDNPSRNMTTTDSTFSSGAASAISPKSPSRRPLLSLPILLTLLSAVLLAFILVLTSLFRQVRKPIN